MGAQDAPERPARGDEAPTSPAHADLDQPGLPVAGQLWAQLARALRFGHADQRIALGESLDDSWRKLSLARISQWRCSPAACQSSRNAAEKYPRSNRVTA